MLLLKSRVQNHPSFDPFERHLAMRWVVTNVCVLVPNVNLHRLPMKWVLDLRPAPSINSGALKIAKISWGPSIIPKMPLILYQVKCFETTSCQFFMHEFDNHGSEKNLYFMNCLTSLYKATNYNLHRHFNKANISFIYRNLETKWYSKGETMLLLQTCPHTATLCSNKRCSESVIGRVTGSAFYQTVVHGGCYHIIIQQVELSLQNKNESLSFLLATMANIKS